MMQTILVPIVKHDAVGATLQTAVLLARQFNSYIEGFSLRFGFSEFVAIDVAGAFPVAQFTQETQEDARQARAAFEAFMREQSIPQATGAAPGLGYGWLEEVPEGEGFIGTYGRTFDVIVMGRPDVNTIGLHNRALESGLFESGRPILISPPAAPATFGKNVRVAWNSSTEQALVTALSMPMLHKAERVTVLTIAGGAAVPGPPGDDLVRNLQRNGISATAMNVSVSESKETGPAILQTCKSLECDLLIKGAYTQSRLRQMIFGGATRHILDHATIPVLMAH
jgi:nucleotide-binding universal stress UspA family protein